MIKWIRKLFCPHTKMFSFTYNNVWKLKCFKCGYESPGVPTGGFVYSKERATTQTIKRAKGISSTFKHRMLIRRK